MAQHGGLGLPRRPAGEEQHGRVLGVAVAQGGGGTVGHQELGPRDQREAGDVPAQARRHGGLHHGQPGRGALEDGPELGVGQAVVHRDIGDVGPGGAEQADGHGF